MNTKYRLFNDQGITLSGEDMPEGHPPDTLYELVEDQLVKYQAQVNAKLADWREHISFRRHTRAAVCMQEIQSILVKTECITDWTVHRRYTDTDRRGNRYSSLRMIGWEFVPHELVKSDLKKGVWVWI